MMMIMMMMMTVMMMMMKRWKWGRGVVWLMLEAVAVVVVGAMVGGDRMQRQCH
jgi:hypothetical protein